MALCAHCVLAGGRARCVRCVRCAGAYVVGTFVDGEESGEDAAPELIMISTGTEVATCMAAARHVPGTVRVVSMPSVELFEAQPRDYQRSVLVPGVPTLSVEPAAQHGWHKYAHGHVCMTTFGTSAPGEVRCAATAPPRRCVTLMVAHGARAAGAGALWLQHGGDCGQGAPAEGVLRRPPRARPDRRPGRHVRQRASPR